VESCTAVVEQHDGKFEIIAWANGELDKVDQRAA
jgi:hypothetical protein